MYAAVELVLSGNCSFVRPSDSPAGSPGDLVSLVTQLPCPVKANLELNESKFVEYTITDSAVV